MALAPLGRRLALPLVGGFLIVFAPPGFREDARLLDLTVEPLDQALEAFFIARYDLCQITSSSL
jgi:hypothetical protein